MVSLHCSGVMEEMVAVASAAGALGEQARERLDRGMAQAARPGGGSYQALAEKRDRLLAYADAESGLSDSSHRS